MADELETKLDALLKGIGSLTETIKESKKTDGGREAAAQDGRAELAAKAAAVNDQKEDEQALKVLTRAHELKPDDSSVRRLLVEELSIAADRQAKLQNWKQAAELLERARAIDPGSPLIASRLAEIRALAAAQR